MRSTIRDVVLTLLVLAVCALAYTQFGAPQLPPGFEEGPAAYGVEKFYRSIYIKGNLTTAGNLVVNGQTTLPAATITSSVASKLTMSEAAGGTITTTTTLTPTATYYQLDPAAQITVTLGACAVNGQLLVLFDDDNQTVNIPATNRLPAAAVALGQNDSLTSICDGAAWVKVHLQDN